MLDGENLKKLLDRICGKQFCRLKGRLYKAFIRSVMCYGAKCWAMKKVDTRQMQTTEMRMVQMMCGKTLLDHMLNSVESVIATVD